MEIKDFFREEGRIEGLEQGLEQGREQGREQGLEQGRKETKETVEKIISNLLSANQHSPAQIARLLKLDLNFVNKVCSEFLVS